jgi:hypothetical protein
VALKYHSYATFAGRANLAMVEMKVDCMTLFSRHSILCLSLA